MKLERALPYWLVIFLCLSGCTALEHLDELSVMGDYSRERDNQDRLVKAINARYDALTQAMAQGKMGDYKDKSFFVYAFGEPILKKDMPDSSQQWLYRYAILSTARDKVYVYFDQHDHLIKWEKVPCPSFF